MFVGDMLGQLKSHEIPSNGHAYENWFCIPELKIGWNKQVIYFQHFVCKT
jgi:hypothetical protein